MGSRTAWATQQIPDQLGLQSKILSQKNQTQTQTNTTTQTHPKQNGKLQVVKSSLGTACDAVTVMREDTELSARA